jgi:copper chaperone CopZ
MIMVNRVSRILVLAALCIGCSEGYAPPPEATQRAFNAAGAPTVEFNVPDMMCPEGCAVATKEILSALPGAKEVVVDFESKTATVAVDEGVFSSEDALAALVDRGFDHSTLKSDAADTGNADL